MLCRELAAAAQEEKNPIESNAEVFSDEANVGDKNGQSATLDALPAVKKPDGSTAFSSIYQKDSYLLFRALCKLSMKGLNEEGTHVQSSNDPIALQNK